MEGGVFLKKCSIEQPAREGRENALWSKKRGKRMEKERWPLSRRRKTKKKKKKNPQKKNSGMSSNKEAGGRGISKAMT